MVQKFGRVNLFDKFQVWRPPLPGKFLSDAAPQWEGLGRIKRICKVCKIQIPTLGKPLKTLLKHSKVATNCFNIWGPSKKSNFCSPKFHGQICDIYCVLFYILHFLLQSFGLLTSYHSVFFSIWETIHQQGKYTFFLGKQEKICLWRKITIMSLQVKIGGRGEIHYFHVCIWQQFEGQDKDRDWFRSASTLLWLLIYICFKCDFSKSPLTLP